MQIKAEILKEVATSKWLPQAAKRISVYSDDLQQHLLLILCEMPEQKLIDVYNQGFIQHFCIKIMMNQAYGQYQKFNKMMSPIGLIDVYEMDIEGNECDESELQFISDDEQRKQNLIKEVVESNRWYEREIFTLWMNGESARGIHRKTKISIREVLRVIKQIKKEINDKYNS